MATADFRIRAPTMLAWVSTPIMTVISGELYFELQRAEPATILEMPFTDGELGAGVIIFGLLAIGSLVWLVSLYLWPGWLRIDEANGVIRREIRRRIHRRIIEAPLGQWRARVVYFSAADQKIRRFKRIELRVPDFDEVLLFTDLKEGETLIESLEHLRPQLGSYDVQVETGGGP